MNLTDPIADLLTRIRNGQHARKADVDIPASKLKKKIADVLVAEGYLKNARMVKGEKFEMIRVGLRYEKDGTPLIRNIQRVSKPGLRRYASAQEITGLHDVVTTRVISTSKGVMTGRQASEKNLGGEIICKLS